MREHWSGFAAEKDRNISTKVSLLGARKITGKVTTSAVHAHSAVLTVFVKEKVFG